MADAIEFGIVANRLLQPDSGIDYILHMKTEALLPLVAERLIADLEGRTLGRGQFYHYFNNLMAERDLLISSRHSLSRHLPVG